MKYFALIFALSLLAFPDYKISFVQNGQVLPERGKVVKIKREPFVLKCEIDPPFSFSYSLSPSPYAAYPVSENLPIEFNYMFWAGKWGADYLGNPQKSLTLMKDGNITLYYLNALTNRFDLSFVSNEKLHAERIVSNFGPVPVSNFRGDILYLTTLQFTTNREYPKLAIDWGSLTNRKETNAFLGVSGEAFFAEMERLKNVKYTNVSVQRYQYEKTLKLEFID